MDAKSETLFRDGSNAKNSEPSSKIEIGQKGGTLYFERGKYV